MFVRRTFIKTLQQIVKKFPQFVDILLTDYIYPVPTEQVGYIFHHLIMFVWKFEIRFRSQGFDSRYLSLRNVQVKIDF